MRKITLLCAVVGFIISGFLVNNVYAQECKVIRVGGASGWLPVSFVNPETQKLTGIANDFAREIGEKLSIPVKTYPNLPWKRVLSYLKHGDLDLSSMYWTKAREKYYQYSRPYFVNEARVFVKKGKVFSFEQLQDLIGRVGGIPVGGSFGDEFDSFAQKHTLKLETVSTKKQLIQMLLVGRIDYFIQDHLDGMMYLKQNNLQNEVVALAHPVSTTNVHFTLSRQSPCIQLLPQINKIIFKARQDNTLQSIIDQYVN